MNNIHFEKIDYFENFVAQYNGDNFLQDIAIQLSKFIEVDYVLIGKLLPDNLNKIKTVALVNYDKLLPDMEYQLKGTPCENVVGRNICYYPYNIQYLFPDDKELADLNIESYVGAPVFDADATPLGLLVLMHSNQIKDVTSIEKILNIITPKVESEMQKINQFVS